MIKVIWYGKGEESMWVEQDGYEGAWIGPGDKRYKALRPVLDLLDPLHTHDGELDGFVSYRLSVSEWDAITEGALLP